MGIYTHDIQIIALGAPALRIISAGLHHFFHISGALRRAGRSEQRQCISGDIADKVHRVHTAGGVPAEQSLRSCRCMACVLDHGNRGCRDIVLRVCQGHEERTR